MYYIRINVRVLKAPVPPFIPLKRIGGRQLQERQEDSRPRQTADSFGRLKENHSSIKILVKYAERFWRLLQDLQSC